MEFKNKFAKCLLQKFLIIQNFINKKLKKYAKFHNSPYKYIAA